MLCSSGVCCIQMFSLMRRHGRTNAAKSVAAKPVTFYTNTTEHFIHLLWLDLIAHGVLNLSRTAQALVQGRVQQATMHVCSENVPGRRRMRRQAIDTGPSRILVYVTHPVRPQTITRFLCHILHSGRRRKHAVINTLGMWSNPISDWTALLPFLLASIHVFSIGLASAVSSRLCVDIIAKLQHGVDSGRITECRPLCGLLDTNNYSISFMDRLSPSCQSVMSRYKGRSSSSIAVSPAHLANHTSHRLPPPVHDCGQVRKASAATNPVVIETDDVAHFVMCTVPKAGCTLLRSLLFALTRDTQGGVSFRNSVVHDTAYPTAWHYKSETDLVDTYPTFVVGRNPYIRLVSGASPL